MRTGACRVVFSRPRFHANDLSNAGGKEVGETRKPAGGWQSVIAVGCLLAASVLSGCAAAVLAGAAGGAGVGAAADVEGEHSQVHNAPMDRTWMATLAALKQMDIRVDTSNKDALGGNIVAKRADGTDVKIKEEPADTPNTTRVKIRIGVFGDQEASETIQSKIDANLHA
jgi:uncharacterized protein DUF3568